MNVMRKKKRQLPNIEYIKEALRYDPNLGQLIWIVRPRHHFVSDDAMLHWNGKFPGKVAGCIRRGHVCVGLMGGQYVAHRICWVLAGRSLPSPEMHLDHINGDPCDNRLSNLRIATYSQNNSNKRNRSDNSSGIKGVSWRKDTRTWDARIMVNKQQYYLGVFGTKELAAAAYANAAKRLHGEFARLT